MWTQGQLVERIDWNEQLFSLRIAVDLTAFTPGQFIKLSCMQAQKRIARAYSLVNTPDKPYAEILAIAVKNGQLSSFLHQLAVGDYIDVTPTASGFMTLDEIPVAASEGKHLWFLATGTAVGPFLSMLGTEEPWRRFEKIVLVYGVREAKDLAYLEYLKALEQQYPAQFILLLSVTREPVEGAIACRIPEGLLTGEIEKKAGIILSPSASQVMICGNPGMITDAQTILFNKGLSKNLRRAPGQVTVEKYW